MDGWLDGWMNGSIDEWMKLFLELDNDVIIMFPKWF